MDWIGGAKEAASAGHDVVMTPTAYCYLDYYQSTNHAAEPKAATWGGPLTLHKVYAFDPMPTNLPPQLQSHILGAQGNLWTEWVPNLKHAEYMIFPRECALAEITWSSPSLAQLGRFPAPAANSRAAAGRTRNQLSPRFHRNPGARPA